MTFPTFPLYWSQEGREAEPESVVRCHEGHIAFKETFDDVGDCPYCAHSPSERRAAVQAKMAAERRLRRA